MLACGHIFHADCVKKLLRHRWSTLRISFEFMACPACKHPIEELSHCEPLQIELSKLLRLKEQVQELATNVAQRAEDLYLEPVNDQLSRWYKRPQEYVLQKCAFYQCHSCSKPFYGGQKECEDELADAEVPITAKDLICKECSIKKLGGGQLKCEIHGVKYITWKCYKCCKEALYFCHGTSYLCADHHHGTIIEHILDCGGVDCPLGVPHPPASNDPLKSMYPLGCSMCRKTDLISQEVELDKREWDVV